MIDCPVPIIAAVNGAAYAGGLEISLCADFICTAGRARTLRLDRSDSGHQAAGAGGTQIICRGRWVHGEPKEIMLTGQPFSARSTPSIRGMVNTNSVVLKLCWWTL